MENNLVITGRIKKKLETTRGTSSRGSWSKQEFILEYTDGNYPNDVCMSVWGDDKVNDLARYQVGETVKVSISLSSREFNGRYYNDIRAWKIEAENASPAAPVQEAPAAPQPLQMTATPPEDNDLPF